MAQPPASPFPLDDGLAQWELDLARAVVRRFLSTRAGLPFEAEDLVQEGLEHWLKRRVLYDAGRGASPKTFMRQVVERRLLDIEERERAASRGGGRRPDSLDAPHGPSAPGGEHDTLGEHAPGQEDTERTALLRLGLKRALSRLSSNQRRVVEARAEGRTEAEIARMLGRGRTTVHDEIERIRRVFREEGLDAFLARRADRSDTNSV